MRSKFNFKFKINKRDILDYNLWYFKTKWSNWLFFMVSILVIFLNLFLAYLKGLDTESIISLFWPTFLMIFFWISIILLTWRQIHVSFKTNKSIQDEVEFSFYDDHIKYKSKSVESITDWKIFYKIVESNNHFFLFISKIQALLLPKRALNKDNDYTNFKQFLARVSRKYKIKSKGLR
jgi:hypothetical protein